METIQVCVMGNCPSVCHGKLCRCMSWKTVQVCVMEIVQVWVNCQGVSHWELSRCVAWGTVRVYVIETIQACVMETVHLCVMWNTHGELSKFKLN